MFMPKKTKVRANSGRTAAGAAGNGVRQSETRADMPRQDVTKAGGKNQINLGKKVQDIPTLTRVSVVRETRVHPREKAVLGKAHIKKIGITRIGEMIAMPAMTGEVIATGVTRMAGIEVPTEAITDAKKRCITIAEEADADGNEISLIN